MHPASPEEPLRASPKFYASAATGARGEDRPSDMSGAVTLHPRQLEAARRQEEAKAGFALPPELSLARRPAANTTPRTPRTQTLGRTQGPRPERFGVDPALPHGSAGAVLPSRSSVRTYTGAPAPSIDREPTGPGEEFLSMFNGTAGLPSWHRKVLGKTG
ncbi:unnamed protein product [Effrenium voratum]|uniref:Uncharacterized protein n=1 Tax=Effrenium voratum TaxID=2562239 RepID=A0AA36HS77_9DINO|nr:unnamed protein product [Effrenium voratum]